MSELRVYPENDPSTFEVETDHAAIAAGLNAVGVRFERWEAEAELGPEASQEEVISAYQADVDRIMEESGFQSVDVIGLHPEHPKKVELRKMFLDEHTHDDFEIRFIDTRSEAIEGTQPDARVRDGCVLIGLGPVFHDETAEVGAEMYHDADVAAYRFDLVQRSGVWRLGGAPTRSDAVGLDVER